MAAPGAELPGVGHHGAITADGRVLVDSVAGGGIVGDLLRFPVATTVDGGSGVNVELAVGVSFPPSAGHHRAVITHGQFRATGIGAYRQRYVLGPVAATVGGVGLPSDPVTGGVVGPPVQPVAAVVVQQHPRPAILKPPGRQHLARPRRASVTGHRGLHAGASKPDISQRAAVATHTELRHATAGGAITFRRNVLHGPVGTAVKTVIALGGGVV